MNCYICGNSGYELIRVFSVGIYIDVVCAECYSIKCITCRKPVTYVNFVFNYGFCQEHRYPQLTAAMDN